MKSQIGPYQRGKARSEIFKYTCQICKICKICLLPRTRLAGRRSKAAVDIFGRATAVTLTLFSSGNAEQAVPCRNRLRGSLRLCRHSVPMARLSVRFITTEREECTIRLSRLNPQMRAAENSEMKHMTYLIQHMIQRMVQRPHS